MIYLLWNYWYVSFEERKNRIMKKVCKILGIFILVLIVVGIFIYAFILQYPKLTNNPKIGKWYRVTNDKMKTSEGSRYRAFFRKGNENKVLLYFAGGGVSVNEETARDKTYNTTEIFIDILSNVTMNMGGLASDIEGNPFKDWNIILFPYATGDFHSGTGEFSYIDNNGNQKILYHNGYVNYTEAMGEIMKVAGIDNVDRVLVTGYSAGGFAAALLSDDIFSNYFPNAESKNVFVDSALLLKDDWHDVAENVWETPKEISDKLDTDNLTLDCFVALREKYGNNINLFFTCSTRDGDLAKVQNYFDNGIMDVDEKRADNFENILRESVSKFKEENVSLFIWNGVAWYNDPRDMTAHTIIATPAVWLPFEKQNKSVAEWILDGMEGKSHDYGLDLIDKSISET